MRERERMRTTTTTTRTKARSLGRRVQLALRARSAVLTRIATILFECSDIDRNKAGRGMRMTKTMR